MMLCLIFEQGYQTIISIALETDLNDPSYSDCVSGINDNRPLVGYKLNSLLGIKNPGQYTYQAFSATIWLKPKFAITTSWQNLFGISSDITESLTKMTLKLTLDQANLICYQSITYENSILNQWIFVGFGYKTSTSSAYLVYSDKYGITKYQTLSCQGQTVGADTKSFQVCIGCLITNNNKYSQFIGKVKNIKLIEGFNDYPNINQYIYFDQDIMDLSVSNINYINVNSLKDLFTYSLPGMQFACPQGYYFLEGICLSSCDNVIRSLTALGSYSPLFTNTNSLSCEICPQNCLACSSSSICTSCKTGFVVDQNSKLCISCSQSTYYDNISQQCVQTCAGIVDLMNRQCITQTDPLIQNSFLFFSSQILTYNEGFQILNSSNIPQQDTFSKCQGNNPYSFFMFYGGQTVLSTQTIQKTWSNLPNNYSKQITFTIVLFNFSSLADLQVYLNEYWQLSVDYVSQNGLINCLNQNFLPNLVINEPLCRQYSFGQKYSSSKCSSCNTNSKMGLNNKCFCNDGYYFFYNQSNLDGQCLQCNPICSKCIGPSYYDCLVCSINYYYQLSSKLCVTQCQTNEFIFVNSALPQNECHQCDDSCLTCQGPSKTDCLTCKNNCYLDYTSKLCVAQCQSNQYQSNNPATGQIMCMPCGQGCLACNGQDQCVTCSQGQFLYQGYCVIGCPNNYQTVLDIYLSGSDPLLTIEFGSQLNIISKYSTPSSEFCNIIFNASTYYLIGATSTCSISGSQILVNLGNDSTIMENHEVILNGSILSFKDQSTQITTFYKTTVSQQYPGVSQLIFNYKDVQNSCNDIAINFSQLTNDANRGLLSINWSIVNFSIMPSQQSLQSIDQILQQVNQNNQTTLNITKYLVPVDSTIKIQVAYKFKVNQTNVQTFLIYYQMDKQIQVQYMQSVFPPFYRYMGISYTFTFWTQICSNNGVQYLQLPIKIQITPSHELNYLQKTMQSYQGQTLELEILQFTLPFNQLSFLNVTFSLPQYPNITSYVSIPLQVLVSPLFVKINGSDDMIWDYRRYPSSEQQYQINLSNQIGEMIINSTMIENQGSIQLQGKEQTILVDRITQKNLINYAKTSQQQQQNNNQTQSYSILILWYFGRKLDQKSLQTKVFSITPENQLPITQKQSIEQFDQQTLDKLKQSDQQKSISQQDQNLNNLKQKKQKRKRQSLFQIEKIDSSPSALKQMYQKKTRDHTKSLGREYMNLTQKMSSDSQDSNKKECTNKIKKIKIDSSPFTIQKEKQIEELQITEIETPTSLFCQKRLISQQNETDLKNQVEQQNSNGIKKGNQNQNQVRGGQNFDKFLSHNFLFKIMIFHEFISIFLVYDEDLSRTFRFQVIYLQVVHSLAMSSYHNQSCALFLNFSLQKQRNIYGNIKYFEIISGTQPSEANQSLGLFLIATGIDFIVYQCLEAIFKNFLIFIYLLPNTTSCLVKFIFDKLDIQEILNKL
ncbi:hypothetical protein ABPG74_007826 [Tetrahymena malaccensis]